MNLYVTVAEDKSQTEVIASANHDNFSTRVSANQRDSIDDHFTAADDGYKLKIFVCESREDSGLPPEYNSKDIICPSQSFHDHTKLKICNEVTVEISTSCTSTVDSGNISDMSNNSSFNKAMNSGNSFLSAKECIDPLETQSDGKLAQLPIFINVSKDNSIENIPLDTSSDSSIHIDSKDLIYYCEHDGYMDKNLRDDDQDSIYPDHINNERQELSAKKRNYPTVNANLSEKCEVISTQIELATSRQSSSSDDTGCETMSGIEDDYLNKSTFMEQLGEYLDNDGMSDFTSPTHTQLLTTAPSIQ